MSVAGSVALAVAERVERTGGPRAGLIAYKKLAENSADGQVRAKALLAALRCGVALRDENALNEITVLWESVDQGVWDEPIAALCRELVKAGFVGRAAGLAYVEKERHRTSRALYMYARCTDIANINDKKIAEAFAEAITRAEKEGSKEIELAARVRRAAVLARSWTTMASAIEEAQRVDLAKVSGASKLTIARVLLASSSRFVRASALGALDDLASSSEHAERALAIAARFADQAGDALTPLEIDRLLALFGREHVVKIAPRANDAMRALAEIVRAKDEASLGNALAKAASAEPGLGVLHGRATDILRGRFHAARDPVPIPAETNARRLFRLGEVLDLAIYIRDGSFARAARALRDLSAADEVELPREILGVAHTALDTPDEELRSVATKFFEVKLSKLGPAPPRGFLALADSLAAANQPELVSVARRAAANAKESGAVETLGLTLAREGWNEAREGHRELAIAKLREAKSLLDRR